MSHILGFSCKAPVLTLTLRSAKYHVSGQKLDLLSDVTL